MRALPANSSWPGFDPAIQSRRHTVVAWKVWMAASRALEGGHDELGADRHLILRAQRLEVGKKAAAGINRLKGKIAATSYLGGTAIYIIDAEGLKLQANTIIDDQVFREGDEVDIGFAPSDCVLLGEDDRRLV
jgi:hypothetical protein